MNTTKTQIINVIKKENLIIHHIEDLNEKREPEEWKTITIKEREYLVSSYGRVAYHCDKSGQTILCATFKDNKGYKWTLLPLDKSRLKRSVSRLVALAFVNNDTGLPLEKLKVMFIDRDKTNLYYKNLKWVDIKTLVNYNIETHKTKPVKCLNTGVVFQSSSLAAEYYNMYSTSIYRNLIGKTKYAGIDPNSGEKLVWQYVSKEDYNEYIQRLSC